MWQKWTSIWSDSIRSKSDVFPVLEWPLPTHNKWLVYFGVYFIPSLPYHLLYPIVSSIVSVLFPPSNFMAIKILNMRQDLTVGCEISMIYKHSFILEIYPFYKFLHCLLYVDDIQALIYLGNFSSLFHMDNNYRVIGFYNQTLKLETIDFSRK